jgi:hypothetical protein
VNMLNAAGGGRGPPNSPEAGGCQFNVCLSNEFPPNKDVSFFCGGEGPKSDVRACLLLSPGLGCSVLAAEADVKTPEDSFFLKTGVRVAVAGAADDPKSDAFEDALFDLCAAPKAVFCFATAVFCVPPSFISQQSSSAVP